MEKKCKHCNTSIICKPSELSRRVFCTHECRKTFTKKSRRTECQVCRTIFYPEKRRNRADQKFCSQRCMGESYATLDYNISHADECGEFIDGFLLSDGFISPEYPKISWNVKYEEYDEHIKKNLAPYLPVSSRVFVLDKRCKNGGYFVSQGRTKCHPDLKRQRERWYPNGIKKVPDDIVLTKKTCLEWYLGDGVLQGVNCNMCTDGFTRKDNNFLAAKLMKHGIIAYVAKRNRVCIFLDGIKKLF